MDRGEQISKWMLSEKEGSTLKFAVEIPNKLVDKGTVAKFKHGCFLKRKDPCSNLPYYINPKMADKGKQISKWMLSEKEGSTLKFADETPNKFVSKGSQI